MVHRLPVGDTASLLAVVDTLRSQLTGASALPDRVTQLEHTTAGLRDQVAQLAARAAQPDFAVAAAIDRLQVGFYSVPACKAFLAKSSHEFLASLELQLFCVHQLICAQKAAN